MARALWALQIAHPTILEPPPVTARNVYMDSYYTSHTLASVVKEMTDGRTLCTSTTKFNQIEGWNKPFLRQAMKDVMDHGERGDWCLVRAYDPPKNWKNKNARTSYMNEFPSDDYLLGYEADSAGYIIIKDRKLVVLYTNDLRFTPSKPVLSMMSEEAQRCVNGMAICRRWVGKESMHRTELEVPAPFVAYNIFMNGVDRTEQRRATNPTRRKEQRACMSIFTAFLDMSCMNAYSLYNVLEEDNAKKMPFREFKRSIILALITPLRNDRKGQKRLRLETPQATMVQRTVSPTNSSVDGNDVHIFVRTNDDKQTTCFLCRKI